MLPIFIETTIHIQRFTATPLLRSRINDEIQNRETITSSYVWMEFQRTLGQDYQYLIDLFREQQPATISELLSLIGEGKNLFSSRKIKRLLHLCAKFFAQTQTTHFDPLETAKLLEWQRQRLLHQQFFEGIDRILDTIACVLVRPEYKIPPGGRMSCRRETACCSLHELLNKNSVAIQNLQGNSAALSALDASTKRSLSEIMSDFTIAKGERNCWSLGDLIIALECPPNAMLWTTNLRHFEPLCQAVGRQLFRPDQR